MKKTIIAQFIILLIGTLFAWINFIQELVNWLQGRDCSTGCSAGAINPFLTPCFYGAMFFLIAFIFSVILLRKFNKGREKKEEIDS
jgi:hypothetical protein